MKRLFLLTITVLAICAVPVIAHHAAEGIVDEEIYAMIDQMVADTPHADLTFDSMGGMTEIIIDTDNYSQFEDLVEELDKSADSAEGISLGGLKADFR